MYAIAKDYLRLETKTEVKQPIPQPISKPVHQPIKQPVPQPVQSLHNQPISKPEFELKITPGYTTDPKVWGPPFWFSLHVSAAHYPENPSQIVRERMKQRILAIPYEVPCSTCRPHASAFVEANRDKLDEIVSNKHSLGKFYVNFHNQVNKRYGKPEWTYEQAYRVYSGKVN